MNYIDDNRIVMTLDAGGTNFVFSAICRGEEIVKPITLPACSQNLEACLKNLVDGFTAVKELLPYAPVAISFAFPGPADYEHGIIGDLPNFPSFRGGVALGPCLEEQFQVPVFINNDGNLFAYGEAFIGALPQCNEQLKQAGSKKLFRNLLGVTLGTGFGAGVVINGELLCGDNGAGGDVWCLRNKKYPQYIVEEGVSIRAIKRVYAELSGDHTDLSPKDIFDIAQGTRQGNVKAAIRSFEELGEMAGDAIASAITLVDGLVVIGGGLAGAAQYIIPSLLKELNGTTGMMDGSCFGRIQMKAYDLNDEKSFMEFAKGQSVEIKVPASNKTINYDPMKRIGVMVSKLGASKAVSMGAYIFALNKLAEIKQ